MRKNIEMEVAIFVIVYTGCPRRNVRNFGWVFFMLNYSDIPQNTYIQTWTVTEIMAREDWNWQEYVVSVMLISVLNIKLTCEWHKANKLNYKNTRVIVVLRLPSTLRRPQLWHQSYHALLTAVYRTMSRSGQAHWTSMTSRTAYSTWTPQKPTHFDGHYLRNETWFCTLQSAAHGSSDVTR
jgi:hypothetical protein